MDHSMQQIIDAQRDQLLAVTARLEALQRDYARADARMRAMERALLLAYCCCPSGNFFTHEDWCPLTDVLADVDAAARHEVP